MWTGLLFIHITNVSGLQPSDMMMFEPDFTGPLTAPGHTGMWLGDNKLIDTPHSGAMVKIETFSPG